MNEITCDVVNDLLPLYAEGAASADSKVLVERHLEGCPACAAKLEKLKTPLLILPETEQHIVERIKRKRRRRLLRNIVIVALIFFLVIGVPAISVCWDLSVKLDASDITVESTDTGQIRLQLSDRARGGILYSIYTQDEEGNTTLYLSLGNNPRLVKLVGRLTNIQSDQENFYVQDFPLDAYQVSWSITDGRVTGVQYNYWTAVGFCDSVIPGDSVTAVYYQPDIDLETDDFREYMENLIAAVFEDASDSDRDWTEEQLNELIISHYEVPESEERTLIWAEE